MIAGDRRGWGRVVAPWATLAMVFGVAAWHAVDFSEVADTEFPRVVRSFFSDRPPAAYRLAEPGDTLDRVGLYLGAAAAAIGLAAIGARVRGGTGVGAWPSALVVSLAIAYHAATPGPTFDGWHGLGFRALLDPACPVAVRVGVGLLVAVGVLIVVSNARRDWPSRRTWFQPGRSREVGALLGAAVALIALRQVDPPGVEPVGYWPRVSFDLGALAWTLALLKARPIAGLAGRGATALRIGAAWGALVAPGLGLMLLHRPLSRLHAVVPGRIYISAMPTYDRLAIEQNRLHFRTIINLFDEASSQGSPLHDDEIRFVREHGLRYLGSPSDGMESDRFLDETLRLAQDPDAWPILVHCHGCMDRSPAWMGMYRFLVEGKPLAEVMQEIERHRGSRPKAVVTLQYNRKLPARDPSRWRADPTARKLVENASRTRDPFDQPELNRLPTVRSVVTRVDPDPAVRRP